MKRLGQRRPEGKTRLVPEQIGFFVAGAHQWHVPRHTRSLLVEAVGGGGGGGSLVGAGGGGSGAYAQLQLTGKSLAAHKGRPLRFAVGKGGVGGQPVADGASTQGTAGSPSVIAGIVLSGGGQPGFGAVSTGATPPGGAGGLGGQVAIEKQYDACRRLLSDGQSGENGLNSNGAIVGGAGGTTPVIAGSGGHRTVNVNQLILPSAAFTLAGAGPGGGGAGTASSGPGGNGADGAIIITYC